MTITDRIEIDPAVMTGKPVTRGTRIPVELIVLKLAEGATWEDLLDAHPRLTQQDVTASLRYAADAVAHEEPLILEGTDKRDQSVRFIADESCDFSIVRALRTAGHDVLEVAEVAPSAIPALRELGIY